MAHYSRKYSRRSSRSIRRSKKIPVILGICALVLLFVGVIVLAATLVGMSLKSQVEKYEEEPAFEYIMPQVQLKGPSGDVREVDAHIFTFDKNPEAFVKVGESDLSVMLRDAEGTLYYNSEIAQSVGWDMVYKSVDLTEKIESIHNAGGYACAYMYLGGFSDQGNLTEMTREYERQLILEAAASGVDEILILGVDVSSNNLDDVLLFISKIKSQAGDCKIGIELDYYDIVSHNEDKYRAQMMLQVCDFLALDASSVPCKENSEELDLDIEEAQKDFFTAIEEIYYYMSGMKVRLAFNNNENGMYKSVSECTYVNRQMHQ